MVHRVNVRVAIIHSNGPDGEAVAFGAFADDDGRFELSHQRAQLSAR